MVPLPCWQDIPLNIREWLKLYGVTSGGRAIYIPNQPHLSDAKFVALMVGGYREGKKKYEILREIESTIGWNFDYCRQVERRLRAEIDQRLRRKEVSFSAGMKL